MIKDNRNSVLVVDLDGTLINTDLLMETFWGLLKLNIFYLFIIPFWLFKGKANLKFEIAKRVDIDVSVLPYNQEVLEYLEIETANKSAILATASNEKFAKQIFDHLGFFDQFIGSNQTINLSDKNKLEAVDKLIGNNNYTYLGNSDDDVSIWQHCKNAVLVNASSKVKKRVLRLDINIVNEFKPQKTTLKVLVKALRIHQWVKNLLIFVPLMLMEESVTIDHVISAFFAFIAFGLCASSVYLLNDLLDLEDDRHHKTKKNRPLANGTLSLLKGTLIFPILLLSSFLIAFTSLSLEFVGVLAFYYILTLSYSFFLKKKVLLDVQVLAGLYTIRIIAGTIAVSTPLSFWLLSFSIFIFLSLAIVKRYTELLQLKKDDRGGSRGRGYEVADIELLSSLGGSAGYISVLVMALFINSSQLTTKYSTPEFLWLMVPIMLYWITRVWIIAHRGLMKDDPIVFAINDKVSLFIAVLVAIILFLAVNV